MAILYLFFSYLAVMLRRALMTRSQPLTNPAMQIPPKSRKRKRTASKEQKKGDNSKKRGNRIDPNECQKCGGRFQEGEELQWVGCDECPRWFHLQCSDGANIHNYWSCPLHKWRLNSVLLNYTYMYCLLSASDWWYSYSWFQWHYS